MGEEINGKGVPVYFMDDDGVRPGGQMSAERIEGIQRELNAAYKAGRRRMWFRAAVISLFLFCAGNVSGAGLALLIVWIVR